MLADKLMTCKEVAEALNLTKQTIWQMEAEGRFPPAIRKPGRFVRWHESDVVAWLNADDVAEAGK